jgi:cyclophilin family peptidyl-prolyl cis-trans isomerase
MENFMIQGGDPNSRNAAPGIPLGAGDPNYTIPAEFNEKFIHKKGALSAARQPDNVNPKKNSSGSQFYIVDGTTFSKSELTTDMNKLNMAAQQLMEQNDSLQQVLFTVYQNQGPQAYGQKLVELKDYIAEQTGADVNKTISDARLEAYTTIGGAPHLDGEYTIFGQVIDGLDIIDKVASQPVDGRDRPLENIPFTVSVDEVSKAKIEKEYGYTFPEMK